MTINVRGGWLVLTGVNLFLCYYCVADVGMWPEMVSSLRKEPCKFPLSTWTRDKRGKFSPIKFVGFSYSFTASPFVLEGVGSGPGGDRNNFLSLLSPLASCETHQE